MIQKGYMGGGNSLSFHKFWVWGESYGSVRSKLWSGMDKEIQIRGFFRAIQGED
jgi:hypothetical protein